MSGLAAGTTYYYTVGGSGNDSAPSSAVWNFTMPTAATTFPQRLALIGDHGHTANSQATTARLLASHNAQPFNALLLAGDLSYADGVQGVWDLWMKQIEPLTARLPFMTIVGNHEFVEVAGLGPLPNLVAYTSRFVLPKPSPLPSPPPKRSLFYSVDIGAVHAVALNSENTTDFGPGTPMYDWLKADLEAADAKRDTVPWIVVYWHRPWYSSNHVHGNDTTMRDAMQGLLQQHNVNVVHNGHVHAYERTHPLDVHGDPVSGAGEQGIIYLTNGMAGNGEGLYDHWVEPQPEFSAFHLAEFGHTELTVMNTTHLMGRMILTNGTVADEWWARRSP